MARGGQQPGGAARQLPRLGRHRCRRVVELDRAAGGPSVPLHRDQRPLARRERGLQLILRLDLTRAAAVSQVDADGRVRRHAERDAPRAQCRSGAGELRPQRSADGEHVGSIDHDQRHHLAPRFGRWRYPDSLAAIGEDREQPAERRAVEHGSLVPAIRGLQAGDHGAVAR